MQVKSWTLDPYSFFVQFFVDEDVTSVQEEQILNELAAGQVQFDVEHSSNALVTIGREKRPAKIAPCIKSSVASVN